MGWNCFKGSDESKDKEEKRSVGERISQTLQTRFPRLYRLIKRIKEEGAPSKLKRRRNRKVGSLVVVSPNRIRAQEKINKKAAEIKSKSMQPADYGKVPNTSDALKGANSAENTAVVPLDHVREVLVQPMKDQKSETDIVSLSSEDSVSGIPEVTSLVDSAVNSALHEVEEDKAVSPPSVDRISSTNSDKDGDFDKGMAPRTNIRRNMVAPATASCPKRESPSPNYECPSPVTVQVASLVDNVVASALEELGHSPEQFQAKSSIVGEWTPDKCHIGQNAASDTASSPQYDATVITRVPASDEYPRRSPDSDSGSPTTMLVASLLDTVITGTTEEADRSTVPTMPQGDTSLQEQQSSEISSQQDTAATAADTQKNYFDETAWEVIMDDDDDMDEDDNFITYMADEQSLITDEDKVTSDTAFEDKESDDRYGESKRLNDTNAEDNVTGGINWEAEVTSQRSEPGGSQVDSASRQQGDGTKDAISTSQDDINKKNREIHRKTADDHRLVDHERMHHKEARIKMQKAKHGGIMAAGEEVPNTEGHEAVEVIENKGHALDAGDTVPDDGRAATGDVVSILTDVVNDVIAAAAGQKDEASRGKRKEDKEMEDADDPATRNGKHVKTDEGPDVAERER